MKFLIGFKKNMTQTYREDGTVVPVTVVQADRCVVTQVKSADKDGYSAVQLGVGDKKKLGKSMAGHVKAFVGKSMNGFSNLREVRLEDASGFNVGDAIDVTMFEPGDKIAVTGTSKGKGFQGVVKRHGFGGSPASHGHKDQLRMPGSIGAQDPQRVFKGTKMAGRMGGDKVTVKNLEVVSIDPENHLLFVKGALPGARNSMVVLMGEGDANLAGNVFEAPKPKEEPKAEATEEKPAEEAKTEEAPAAEAEVKEEAKAEEPKAEEKAPEAAKKEAPKEEAKTEEPKAEEKKEESAKEESKEA